MPVKRPGRRSKRVAGTKTEWGQSSVTDYAAFRSVAPEVAAAAAVADQISYNDELLEAPKKRLRARTAMDTELTGTRASLHKDADQEDTRDGAVEDGVDYTSLEGLEEAAKSILVGEVEQDADEVLVRNLDTEGLLELAAAEQRLAQSRDGSGNVAGGRRKGARVIRAMKDLSAAQDKLERIYGRNRKKLLGLAKWKEGFETNVFNFPDSLLQPESKYYVPALDIFEDLDISGCNYKPVKHSLLSMEEFLDRFPIDVSTPKDVTIANAEFTLYRDHKAEFPVMEWEKRIGFIYNVGGLITDMAWLRNHRSHTQYLAVGVSSIKNADDMRLKISGIEKHVAIIEIYALNPSDMSFVKYQTIVHEFGETWDLKWNEGYHSDESVGLLGFVCQAGGVRFIEVQKCEQYEIRALSEAHIDVSMENAQISCFDFLSSDTIICGFYNGYVGRFQLGDSIPELYAKVHDTYVLAIVTAYSPYEETTICSTAVDGTSFLFNTKSIKTTKCALPRNRGTNISPLAYVPQLYSIVHTDGINSLRAFTPRAVFGTHQLCQHKNNIGCIGTSRLHPYVLSGAADGTIILNNVVRRMLQGIKGNTETYKYIRLWKWDYNVTTNYYRLDPTYEVSKSAVNENSNTRIDPTPVNIQAVKWNETRNCGKFYAFANAAGLLVIEKLGGDS
ncbi:AER249Cp [Eremothecium gossypii ATCC 10895]|uniref:AER249Cp n=1 Tax=Eremothecium gossypii (strain ATCC 10895 / CBS 109.51 / FGSC 9923 / NRRL Y-1056) TaxID=284811 RepID=Q756K5_EREGS|nr:AER249Cp [Eremothecium gossypii ATCC 10895]AAS52930.2 AER249Cp [Eremothecium gossypii ATCC 10895]AEY97238.1 FAER249Cp [Eremothecium gossypii FDAG1]